MFKQFLRMSAVTAVAVFCLPSLAQSAPATNPWNGSWKVVPTSMYYEGAIMSFAADASGYVITSGGVAAPRVDCSGKPATSPAGSAVTCTKTASGYAMTSASKDGKSHSTGTVAFSKDGKQMTRTIHGQREGEEAYTTTLTFTRIGSGMGLTGDWRQSSFTESSETGILTIAVTGDSVAFKETDTPKPIVCKLDGTPTELTGSAKISVTQVDPHTLKVRYMSGDKVARENTFVLSLDGTMISETDFTPAPGALGMTQVFHKM